ncbi:MAG: cell division protein FtsZ, partial [Methylophilaceae bacterium]|nr:cell division protein FtsZ [Methylophilaceae bacterium]
SAEASGENRAIIAAEQAVASPLLEDVNLANARGVLVNITSNSSFKMKEYYNVMNTIKAFTAEDATVIVGTVMDETIGDKLRVTMVATGLNGPVAKREQKPELRVMTTLRDGTNNMPIYAEDLNDEPAVFSSNSRRAQVDAMKSNGVEEYDIPAFLRKQAD